MKKLSWLILGVLTVSAPVFAQTILTVTHGPLEAPTYIDVGDPGESVGDVRIWRFSARTSSNEDAMMDWMMTTTGHMDPTTQLESRMTTSVLTVGNVLKDTVLLQGIGFYPAAGAALKRHAPSLERAVIGGTGRYAGAQGVVRTTHLPDGSWAHVFYLD
jgi:hypothetical protein